MNVKLVVVEGLRLGTVISVREARFLVGRDPRCHLRPHSTAVSGLHCVIRRRGDEVSVQDLGSTNGTLVNDICLRRGQSVKVRDGDRLQVAQLIFTFRLSREGPQDTEEIVDWLAPEAERPSVTSASRTQILPAVAPRAAGSVPHNEGRHDASHQTAALEFRFRRFAPERHLVVAGLSPVQIGSLDRLVVLREVLMDWAGNVSTRVIVLDLSGVDLVPSSVFAMLHTLARRCRESGGRLRVCGCTPDVRRTLATLKLDQMLDCYDTLEEAEEHTEG